jgi:hypothetical protein
MDLLVPVNESMRPTVGGGNQRGVERQVVGARFMCLGGGNLAIVESESSLLPGIFNCQSRSM